MTAAACPPLSSPSRKSLRPGKARPGAQGTGRQEQEGWRARPGGEGASLATTAARSIASKLSDASEREVTEDQVKQVGIAVAKEAAKQGVRLSSNQLERYVEQAVKAHPDAASQQQGSQGSQGPDQTASLDVPLDQPRAMAAAA